MERVLARCGLAVGVLGAVQVMAWTLAPALTHDALPLDVVEMLVWGREGVVATYKHPNLPGLLLEAARQLSAGALWICYVLAQLCVVASFSAVYLLGRDLMGPQKALAGTLLLTGIFYYSWPTPELNHNLVQMPLWAWTGLALWRASQTGRMRWWLLLGAFGGLSLWAKYSSGLLLVAAGAWILLDRQTRRQFVRPGPWVALAISSVIVLPQLRFLIESGFLPLDYAVTRAETGRVSGPVSFLLAQIADHIPFFLMAFLAGLLGRNGRDLTEAQKRVRRYLLLVGLGPVLGTVALAWIADLGLRHMWGMPMFNFSGLLLVSLVPDRCNGRTVQRLVGLAACFLGVIPAVYAAAVLWHDRLSDKALRVLWPQQHIADTLLDNYAAETGTVPRIIVGPVWEAGLVALAGPRDVSVSIDGDVRKSPWVTGQDIARHGALAVWSTDAGPEGPLATMMEDQVLRHETFRWSDSPSARPLRITWTVIPPRTP